jgi:hypothetical protein
VLLLWSIFPALDALRELCDHPKSYRLQQTLRHQPIPLGSCLPTGEAISTKRVELEQVEERLAIGANLVHETIRHPGELGRKQLSAATFGPALASECHDLPVKV